MLPAASDRGSATPSIDSATRSGCDKPFHRRVVPAREIAGARALDLDHPSAEVRELACGKRRRDGLLERDDGATVQRQHCHKIPAMRDARREDPDGDDGTAARRGQLPDSPRHPRRAARGRGDGGVGDRTADARAPGPQLRGRRGRAAARLPGQRHHRRACSRSDRTCTGPAATCSEAIFDGIRREPNGLSALVGRRRPAGAPQSGWHAARRHPLRHRAGRSRAADASRRRGSAPRT